MSRRKTKAAEKPVYPTRVLRLHDTTHADPVAFITLTGKFGVWFITKATGILTLRDFDPGWGDTEIAVKRAAQALGLTIKEISTQERGKSPQKENLPENIAPSVQENRAEVRCPPNPSSKVPGPLEKRSLLQTKEPDRRSPDGTQRPEARTAPRKTDGFPRSTA